MKTFISNLTTKKWMMLGLGLIVLIGLGFGIHRLTMNPTQRTFESQKVWKMSVVKAYVDATDDDERDSDEVGYVTFKGDKFYIYSDIEDAKENKTEHAEKGTIKYNGKTSIAMKSSRDETIYMNIDNNNKTQVTATASDEDYTYSFTFVSQYM